MSAHEATSLAFLVTLFIAIFGWMEVWIQRQRVKLEEFINQSLERENKRLRGQLARRPDPIEDDADWWKQ